VTETGVTTSSGSTTWTINERDLALVHYLAGGARDLSFGTGGIAIMPVTPTGVTTLNATGNNIAVQPDGAIVEVGTEQWPSDAYNDMVLARYSANGTPDTTFGGGAGYTLIDMGTLGTYPSGDSVWSLGDSVALQPNGQILAAGTVATSFGSTGHPAAFGFATVRLNSDGSLDPTFGTNGAAITQVLYNEYDPVSIGLETLNNQTMIVDATRAMVSSTNATQEFALVRYTPSGSLDSGTASAATPAALSTQSAGTVTSLASVPRGGSLAGTPMGLVSAGLVGSAPAAPSIIPVAGLVPQALDTPGYFDTLLTGRKRR
jgi:uncharacterized delta-60 repeat protein